MRVLIVDDERLARRRLRRLVEACPDVAVVGECSGANEALAAVEEFRPDAVFLDVQMPGGDGFDVVRRVGPERMPPVVFVTAYDAHAVAAFEVDAVDYLLKPIDATSVRRAVSRLRRSLEAPLAQRLEALLRRRERPWPERLAIRERGRSLLVPVDEVDWIGAEGNYARLHTKGRPYLLRSTLSELERRLDPERFVRIHRSTIVRLDRLREVETGENGELAVTLRGGTRLAVGPRYREVVRRLVEQG